MTGDNNLGERLLEATSEQADTIAQGQQEGQSEKITVVTGRSKQDPRREAIAAFLQTPKGQAYNARIEEHGKSCLTFFLTKGVAAVLVGTTVLGFLTPLNALMLVDRINNSSAFDTLNLDQTTTFAAVVGVVFVPKGIWVVQRMINVYGQADKRLFNCNKRFTAFMHGFLNTLAPLSLVVGVTLGNILSRAPDALPWWPQWATPPRAFGLAGAAALGAELATPDDRPGEHESFVEAWRFICSRFKELPPWESVVLFLLTAHITASAETGNYFGHPVETQAGSLGLTATLGTILVVMGSRQTAESKWICNVASWLRSRLSCANASAQQQQAAEAGSTPAPEGDLEVGGDASGEQVAVAQAQGDDARARMLVQGEAAAAADVSTSGQGLLQRCWSSCCGC
jgi:hypothetical protein